MRVLTQGEIEDVTGGLNDFQEGGLAIMGMSIYSPVTFAFGFPIGGAMFAVGSIGSFSGGGSSS